jgi:hypothetical protein
VPVTHARATNAQKMRARSRVRSILSDTFRLPPPAQASCASRLAESGTRCRARHT